MTAGKSTRVNRQYKTKYRIGKWREYERGLRSRGDVTIWLSKDAIVPWVAPKNGLRGGQRRYWNLAIRPAWMLRVVFGLPQRQTEEFLDSLLRLMGRDLKAPDHTLSRSGTKSLRCRPGPDPATARSTGSSIPGGSRFRVAANGTRTSTRHRRDAGMGGSCTSGWIPRGSWWRPKSQRAAGTTPPHSLIFSNCSRFPHGVSSRTGPTTTGQSTIRSTRPLQRTS